MKKKIIIKKSLIFTFICCPEPSAEHYVGNEVIHYLTHQRKYVLNVTLTNWDGESTVALYNHFMIDNEETGYRLHIQGFSGKDFVSPSYA